jgi:hypothetical protein
VRFSTKLSNHNDLGGQRSSRHRYSLCLGVGGGEDEQADAVSETQLNRRRANADVMAIASWLVTTVRILGENSCCQRA